MIGTIFTVGYSTSESDVFILVSPHDDYTAAKTDMLRQS